MRASRPAARRIAGRSGRARSNQRDTSGGCEAAALGPPLSFVRLGSSVLRDRACALIERRLDGVRALAGHGAHDPLAKLVDASDLKSAAARRAGSSPAGVTKRATDKRKAASGETAFLDLRPGAGGDPSLNLSAERRGNYSQPARFAMMMSGIGIPTIQSRALFMTSSPTRSVFGDINAASAGQFP